MIVIISVRVGTEGFNLPVGEGSSLHLYWCWEKGCSSFEWSSVVRFSLFPRTKLYKFKTNQIGYFSFLIAGLPPTEGSARRAKGVQFLKRRSIIAQGVRARPVGGAGGGADWNIISQPARRLYGFYVLLFLWVGFQITQINTSVGSSSNRISRHKRSCRNDYTFLLLLLFSSMSIELCAFRCTERNI